MRKRPGTSGTSPCQPHEITSEAALHEKAVAHVDRRIRIRARAEHGTRGAVEVRHGHGIAAVDHVEHDAPAALRAVDGQQDRHVRAPLDAAAGALRGELHVGDAPVGGVQRVDGEVETPLQLLVRPDVAGGAAPRGAVRERATKRDLESGHGHVVGLLESVGGAVGPTFR